MLYDGRWRDRDPAEAPPGAAPVIRLKAPREGDCRIDDLVQGTVTVANSQLDDMVLLRADGTPTYMHSVVVDDHDMAISHAIRGDDHLTNAFRQTQLYRALDWEPPKFAHIPLIHGPDGAKLSKRHGALGIDAYREMGYLPAALRNYLLRLGWAHGDDEIISTQRAIEWFDLDGVSRGAARFDFTRLDSLNAHYLRHADDAELIDLVLSRIEQNLGETIDETGKSRIKKGMIGLKGRAKTIRELAENTAFYVRQRPLPLTEKAAAQLSAEARALLGALMPCLEESGNWTEDELQRRVGRFAEEQGLKLGKVAQPLRAALTGSTVSPGIFEVMATLGRRESLARIGDRLDPSGPD
jgi:glutamyl-tRNA synthetase